MSSVNKILAIIIAVISVVLFSVFFVNSDQQAHKSGLFQKTLNNRTYNVYVPENLPDVNNTAYLVLHGSGGTSEETMEATKFNTLADEEKFITVYPQGWGETPDWNGGGCCGSSTVNNIDDVKFIADVIVKIKQVYNVEKVYVTGFSSGGIMAYRVGCELSGMVTGIGVASGVLTLDKCDSSAPLLHIHGMDDDVVPFTGGYGPDGYNFRSTLNSVEMYSKSGAYTETLIVSNHSHAWLPYSAETFVNFFKQHS